MPDSGVPWEYDRMKRAATVFALLVMLSACGGEAPRENGDDARCSDAKKAKKDADQLGKDAEEQAANPATALARFHHDLEHEKIYDDGLGMLYSQQLAYQIVSDNPSCFSPGRVADARIQLKIIDPLAIRAANLMAKQGKEAGFRELDRLWENDTNGDR